MRYAVLSDAHGNKPYFDECIKVVDSLNIQGVIYLGDMFGYMPDGLYIFKTLRDRKACILKGNHEAMLLGEIRLDMEKDKIYGLREQRRYLSKDDRTFLIGLKTNWTMERESGKFLFVHGAPFDPLNGYLYEDNQEYAWNEQEYCFIFMGHTHRPFIKNQGKTTFVNVGSCGMPRDIGLSPSFCVFDDKNLTVEIIRFPIDPEVLESDYYFGINDKVSEVLRRK